jgi:hypothetical protein
MMLGFRTIYGLGVAVSLNSHLTEIIPSSNGTWNWDMIGIYFRTNYTWLLPTELHLLDAFRLLYTPLKKVYWCR